MNLPILTFLILSFAPFLINASRLIQRAKVSGGKEPKTLFTDGLRTYGKGSAVDFPHATHVKEIRLAGAIHNSKMERMNGQIRDRKRARRGVKVKTSPIIKGFQIYRSFIRKYEALDGKTPPAGDGIGVEGTDKRFTIIGNAKHPVRTEEP